MRQKRVSQIFIIQTARKWEIWVQGPDDSTYRYNSAFDDWKKVGIELDWYQSRDYWTLVIQRR